jgi:hypothetical protein
MQVALGVLQIFVNALARQVGGHGPPINDGISAHKVPLVVL